MSELILEPARRLALRARAHHLPVRVRVGAQGLSEALRREIGRALDDAGLVKIQLAAADRAEREAQAEALAGELAAARVALVGRRLTLWRPPLEKAPRPVARRGAPDAGGGEP